jgi:hypothetical protein
MKIESAEYSATDLIAFINDLQDQDRQLLADRLERASKRLAEVGPRVKPGRGGGDEWSDVEVLAHIAGFSKFYGVLVHRMVSGQVTDVDFLQATQMRDGSIDQMANMEPAELLRMALADHARTVNELRTVAAGSLRRRANLPEGGTMTAEEVARLSLVVHLENHVNQLEKSLGG